MLQYQFMQNAILVSFMIAILCPCIGVFLVLRRYSMIGDTLSHSSLAGVSLGLLVHKNPILGAFLFTSACGLLIEVLRKYFKKFTDLILSIVLSLSVGIAISIISSGKLNANAESYLFGSILTVSRTDLITIFILSLVSFAVITIFYHELLYISYDEEAAKVSGVKVPILNYVFALLVASCIAASVRIVGVLVLSSMISLPVATAIQLKKGFRTTLIASILFSVFDIMTGLILSYYINVAPGGFTAIVSVIVLLIVILAKKILSLLSRKG
ncbi:MAG: zinc transport system permease protein [Clostridiales bacterium]|nr:zinc transport system permease protein [Clostridiales bacterium]